MLSNEDETYSAVRCIEQQLETSRSDDRMQSPSVGNRTEERKELNTEGDSHNSDLGKINETLRSAENPSRESALFENVTFERSAGSRPPEEGSDVGEETASEDVVYCGTVDLEQASIELMERLLETIDDTDVASSSVNDVLTSADEALNENSAIYLSSDSEEVSTVDEEESERFNKRSTELVDDGEEETSQSCAYVDDIIGFDDTDRNSEWPLTDERIIHKVIYCALCTFRIFFCRIKFWSLMLSRPYVLICVCVLVVGQFHLLISKNRAAKFDESRLQQRLTSNLQFCPH